MNLIPKLCNVFRGTVVDPFLTFVNICHEKAIWSLSIADIIGITIIMDTNKLFPTETLYYWTKSILETIRSVVKRVFIGSPNSEILILRNTFTLMGRLSSDISRKQCLKNLW